MSQALRSTCNIPLNQSNVDLCDPYPYVKPGQPWPLSETKEEERQTLVYLTWFLVNRFSIYV